MRLRLRAWTPPATLRLVLAYHPAAPFRARRWCGGGSSAPADGGAAAAAPAAPAAADQCCGNGCENCVLYDLEELPVAPAAPPQGDPMLTVQADPVVLELE